MALSTRTTMEGSSTRLTSRGSRASCRRQKVSLRALSITSRLTIYAGKVVLGGKTGSGGPQAKDRGIEPTLVAFDSIKEAEADIAMQDELFGPILPVVGVENVAEACGFVRRR
jgi:acyl-CoA reductase-like NAD-dependent aldehyde dehydrogenase